MTSEHTRLRSGCRGKSGRFEDCLHSRPWAAEGIDALCRVVGRIAASRSELSGKLAAQGLRLRNGGT